jgi:hypothetical protein
MAGGLGLLVARAGIRLEADGSMPLKRSLTIDGWTAAIKDVRARVETSPEGELALYE